MSDESKFMEEYITDMANRLRTDIRNIGEQVQRMHKCPDFNELEAHSDESEMRANIQLAFRHLEDARMRLGKVIQAKDGGVSCYEK